MTFPVIASPLSGDVWMAGFTAVCLFLAGAAAVGWLVAGTRAWTWVPVRAWFRSLPRVHKLAVLVLMAGATYYGGSKTGGGNGGGDDGAGPQRAPQRIRAPEWTDDGTGPTNLFAITDFNVCPTNQTVAFTVEWNAAYLAAMDSRCADIFFSTNLLSPVWMKIAWRWLPEETNRLSFTLDPWDVDWNYRTAFTNSFSSTGFYTLGLDFDSDGDRLTDAFERYVSGTSPYRADTDGDGLNDYNEYRYGTDPRNPDSDGDGVLDGEEVYQYSSDPFSGDSDGDGLPDWMEADGCFSARSSRWIEDAAATNVLTTGGADVDRAVWHVTLPSPVSLAGGVYSNLTIDVNGIIYLSTTNITVASRDTPSPIWDEGWNPTDIAVAALWTDLVAKTNLDSQVSFNVTETGDEVVEFLNMGFAGTDCPTNTCSFQIVFSPSATNRVMVFWRGIDTDVFYDLDSFPVAGVRLDTTRRTEYSRTSISDGDSFVVWRFGFGTDPNEADTDGDELNDGDEILAGTDPLSADTDGDGLPDGWETAYGLDPLSAVGDDGAEGDPDGDGLTNREEYQHGSAPDAGDEDDDGLTDLAEIGGIVAGSPLPWLDTTTGTDLTALFATGDGACVDVPLPRTVLVNGKFHDSLSLDKSGVVHLNETGYTNETWSMGWPSDPARMYGRWREIFLAPFWTEMELSCEVPASAVRVADVSYGGREYCVVEYDNLRGYADSRYTPQRVSFQMAVPYGLATNVHVRYGTVVGADMDGSLSGVGFVRAGETCGHSYCFEEPGKVTPGLGLTFVLGTGTDTRRADTDADGVPDSDEAARGLDATRADTDGDGLPDGWEVGYGLDALSAAGPDGAGGDPDGDGLTNAEELTHGTDPCAEDTDADGLPDGWEIAQGLNPLSGAGDDGGAGDPDEDGLSNASEYAAGTDPFDADTDDDGLPDGWEVQFGLEPLSAWGADGAAGDPDGDGLDNAGEYENNTDPVAADTDGDGVADWTEVRNGSDPTNPGDNGQAPAASDLLELPFTVSGDYTSWEMSVSGRGPLDTRSFRLRMTNYDTELTVPKKLRKGNSYDIRLRCLVSRHTNMGNWYCWSAKIDGKPQAQTYTEWGGHKNTGVAEFVRGLGWFADNADGLLTEQVHTHDSSEHSTGVGNIAGSLSATLHVPKAEVTFVEADDDTWETELPQEKVMLSDQPVRIRIRISPGITTMEQAKEVMGNTVTVKTTGTAPQGVAVPIGDGDTGISQNGCFEIRMERTLAQLREAGLLPTHDDDGVTEMAWWDNGLEHPAASSNLTDSQAFGQLNAEFRGKATRYGTLESQPPNSRQHVSFFQAAGAEIITATYGGTVSSNRQIQNQADYFYYSGHGNYADGEIAPNITPSMVENKWNKDLDCVIFSACSVFDIGDYNNNFGNQISPGLLWARSGAHFLFGYNYIAPSDGGGASTRIINYWRTHHTTDGVVDAWMEANAQNRAWNACAIENTGNGVRYTYFARWMRVFRRKTTIQIGD